ncbi:related to cell division protein CDC50 [Cephalotrichum gorgonifer]|uniref:Related to cell division protein CDC50 n=1 Tax=Cephalotrichum gorgonifer TaxID=2041049 RepID=A0AAE8MPS9_9PEZI|nr:related to cell division protein CDC50 [Cephalotrichum gorgonifer]
MADSPPGAGRADSIDSRDDIPNQPPEKKKSRRPANTAFRQQRLKAWQPILTPKTVLPLFFTIGIIFAPIGGLLLYASSQVQEIQIDYTKCGTDAPTVDVAGADGATSIPPENIITAFKSNSKAPANAMWSKVANVTTDFGRGEIINATQCVVQFTLPEDFTPPVLFYYRLTNFYQNHRRYVQSFNDLQLKGDAVSGGTINSSNCDPLRSNSTNGLPYYPCGLIANSLFNDTFSSPALLGGDEPVPYPMKNNSGIAWGSDKDLYGKTKYKPSEIWPPPNWEKLYPDGYTEENPPPNLEEWEGFMVWMRTAGLPTFSKLYQRNDDEPMRKGTYRVLIADEFPASDYKGTKSIVISTRTVMGGRNPFLGIAYVVVGGLCIVLGAIFTVTHLIKPRKLGDHTYLSWNNTPANKTSPSTGITTGREARDVA